MPRPKRPLDRAHPARDGQLQYSRPRRTLSRRPGKRHDSSPTASYPTDAFDAIYLAGGSYGTVPAQMLFGAPYETFPPGRKVVSCFLIAGFSPLKYDTRYAVTLSWRNWLAIGPPSQLPFRPVQRLLRRIIAAKMETLDGARAFLKQTLLDDMDGAERVAFADWLRETNASEDEFVDHMARGAIKCCRNWVGFMEVADVLRDDWGFEPCKLDEEHVSKPVLVVESEDDHLG